MGQRFVGLATGAGVALAALLTMPIASGAQAGDVAPPQDLGDGARASTCIPGGQPCAHISGYIKAGANASSGGPDLHAPRIGPPALLAGVGALGQAAADALSHGFDVLDVRHEQRAW